MLLYVVRHAQSESNVKVTGAGKDSRLTQLGRRQAQAVAARLAEIGIDRVLASPYTRALETAEAIRQATVGAALRPLPGRLQSLCTPRAVLSPDAGVPAGIVPLLHEHHVEALASDRAEDWPLMSRTVLAERYPHFELPADFAFDPKWHDIPEEDAAVVRRGKRVLEDLWQRFAAPPEGDQNVKLALVTHGSPAGKLLMAVLGIDHPAGIAIRIDNASISIVDWSPTWKVLVASNRVDHLLHLEVDLKQQDPGTAPQGTQSLRSFEFPGDPGYPLPAEAP
ncbi:MAG TPA: histidine phosphatase family protein [Actinomycetota bacterium]